MGMSFDELAKDLARGVSRRTAIKRFLGSAFAASVGALVPWRVALADNDSNNKGRDDRDDRDEREDNEGLGKCIRFCRQTFGSHTPASRVCIDQARKHTGLCFECGPAAPRSSHMALCGSVCCPEGNCVHVNGSAVCVGVNGVGVNGVGVNGVGVNGVGVNGVAVNSIGVNGVRINGV
jgi:hypothetical protein